MLNLNVDKFYLISYIYDGIRETTANCGPLDCKQAEIFVDSLTDNDIQYFITSGSESEILDLICFELTNED